jgi:hypothetical protein
MKTFLKALLYVSAPLIFWFGIGAIKSHLSSWATEPSIPVISAMKEHGISGKVSDEHIYSLLGIELSEVREELEFRKRVLYSVVFGLWGVLFVFVCVEAKFLASKLKT